MFDATGKGKWQRVTATSPCPICKAADWCSVSVDAALAKCMRVAQGANRTKTDKNGAEYYLHRLGGKAEATSAWVPPPAGATANRAEADTLHGVYGTLLAHLTLSAPHRDNLRGRGLSEEAIDRGGYRTLPVQGRARLARALREQFGDKALAVPGLVVKQGESGPYLSIAGAAGLLVPVRDPAGRVVALKVRRDDGGAGSRYSYLSSTKHGGPGPGSPAHVPLGVTGPCLILRVTEGELKSDVATARSGLPTVSVAGVGNWRAALAVVRELQAKTVRLAYDADAADKPQVARPLAAFAEALAAEGVAFELERWPAEHKGIDDALAAGVPIEVLAGDAARQAVADTLAEATAGEAPQEASALDRLSEVMAEGGAAALFRDKPLLTALARLSVEDAAAFAAHKATLKGGVSVRDLDKALKPLIAQVRAEKQEGGKIAAGDDYLVQAGYICRRRMVDNQPLIEPLCNFAARIVEQTVHDDGAERRLTLAVEGALANGAPLARADVPADQFGWMRWPVEAWGPQAVVFAGAATADHTRAALQLLSGCVPRRTVYGHTGWREIEGDWYYLHAGGAIGSDGPAAGVEVALPDPLAGFRLPDPPRGAALADAIRASLRLVDGLAPDRIAFPVLAAVYRAALGAADFSLHLSGPTGNYKTELGTLGQQHYGADLHSRQLPGSWSSTGNALEGVAFAAKEALLLVDDFAPTGSTADVQRFHREADRLLRAQGNRTGRQRMRADGTLRPAKPPRGLILSTGEDVPRGQSLRSRMLVDEVSPGDVRVDRLTECQRDAAAGLYAQALAGFVRWLAPRYADWSGRLRKEAAELRDRARIEGQHARTPGIAADLALGLRCLLNFARAAEAVTPDEVIRLWDRGWAALLHVAAEQAAHVAAAEPAGLFLRLLSAAVASGRAHVAGADGANPEQPERWGWRAKEAHDSNSCGGWQPMGRRVGWVDGGDLYLEPEACFAEVQDLARVQGDSVPVGSRTLYRRMKEKGLLASWDEKRQRNTIRRTLEGVKDREVIHLHSDVLSLPEPSEPSANPPESPETGEKRTVSADGAADGNGVCGGNRPPIPSAEHAENAAGGRFGRSDKGEEAPIAPKKSAPPGKRRRGEL